MQWTLIFLFIACLLFIWLDEAYRNFWMKNTPSSLDIIFFDKNGYFINVQENTIPYSLDNILELPPIPHPTSKTLEPLGNSFKPLQ